MDHKGILLFELAYLTVFTLLPNPINRIAEISAVINEEIFEYLKSPIKRVTALDTPIPFDKRLEEFILPKKSEIIDNVIEVLGKE